MGKRNDILFVFSAFMYQEDKNFASLRCAGIMFLETGSLLPAVSTRVMLSNASGDLLDRPLLS